MRAQISTLLYFGVITIMSVGGSRGPVGENFQPIEKPELGCHGFIVDAMLGSNGVLLTMMRQKDYSLWLGTQPSSALENQRTLRITENGNVDEPPSYEFYITWNKPSPGETICPKLSPKLRRALAHIALSENEFLLYIRNMVKSVGTCDALQQCKQYSFYNEVYGELEQYLYSLPPPEIVS